MVIVLFKNQHNFKTEKKNYKLGVRMSGVWVFKSQNANSARKKIHYQIRSENHILKTSELIFPRKSLLCASVSYLLFCVW